MNDMCNILKENIKNQDLRRDNSSFATELLSHLKPIKLAPFVEWGCPHGKLARIFPLSYLNSVEGKVLWLYDRENLNPYAPTWEGIKGDLESIHFVKSDRPIKDLRPLFSDSTYKTIVIDTKEFLSNAELSYLRIASTNNQRRYFLIRPFYLSSNNGNPFCRFRINCFFSFKENRFKISYVKGNKGLSLKMKAVGP